MQTSDVKTVAVALYVFAFLSEVGGLGTIVYDLRERRRRVRVARERRREATLTWKTVGIEMPDIIPQPSSTLEDRVSALEQLVGYFVEQLAKLPPKLQRSWRDADAETASNADRALDEEIARLERFVGIEDSIKRPLIGVTLVIVGAALGMIASLLALL